MATAAVDTQYLSGYLDVPVPTLNILLDTPTAELVQAILEAVAVKAHEHDELVADKLRLDIELENAVRSSETRVEGLRSSIEKAQKTVEEVRTKLKEEENARSSLESELETLRSSSSTSTSEVETLRARIASLESANRDTVAVLESKTTANDGLSQDLQKQHQKGLELSQQITNLQQSVQNANSAASSAKFREQSLKQEVELAKRNNEWFENELKTKSAEALKYRKEKGARIAELQRLNEEANSNLEALRRTEQALRSRLDEVQKKAEDSLLKVQQLQESAAKTEEGFRQELESARRLAELQSQQTETHRNRLQEVEAGLEKAKDDAAEEVGRCRQEAEAERQDREHAEHRIAELEAEIDRLEALTTAPNFAGSVPGTPRQGLNGSVLGRSGSPFGTPGSVRSKSTITATQAIEELYKVKGQLATEKRHSAKLEAEIDEMMQGLEAKVPEHEELQAELQRLQQEVVEMSKFVDQTGKERDRAKKDARKAESQASTAQAEANILRQQLRDLSAQIKMLLCDLDARERGLAALSASERSQLERLARGEVSEEALEGMTDTDKFISQRLTVFRNISELQEKNQELLKITRQLGAQMESEEAISAKHQAAKDHEEVQNLLSRIEGYKDELQSMVVRSESYIKERDMFRRMLQHRGPIPPGSELASLFAQSVDGSQNGVMHSTEQNPQSRDNTNYATLLRELQGHFDQYREEQSTDRRTMKEQTEKLSLEKGSLQAEISKISSQLTFANERYEMLHSNYIMLQNENTELQKRSQVLSEAAAKQDLRTQQVAEDLIEAKGLVESMRNENANLKAEKKLWKDIQDRLSQDNESLMNERSRLNGLIANQQTLQNERELSESETRRRLQTQVESLEAELSTTKRKLSDEVEDSKKAQLRKEYDSQQTQKRIDDLVNSLGTVREELVAAKTTRDHLQARVDELTIELKSAEERVEVLQPRPTPRPGMNGNTNPDNTADMMQEDTLTKEQELSIEVSELKRDLELTKSDLENIKSQMEQYRSISQSSEEELQSLNETQDQYREEMDRVIEEKDSKIRELQQRVDDISTELATTNNEMTTLRNQQADVARQAEEEKAALEVEISRLKDEDERHATAAQFHQQDLRAQAAIATKAQQDYENELVKHAEAAKILQNLRAEYNQLKTEGVTLRAEAESAKVTLSQSEASWEERREHFEQELKELRTRRDDVNTQNKLLHEQLDGLSSQILALQQSRSTLTESAEAGSSGAESTDRATEGLRELNTFLRREKEILEVQYELKVQEAKRLQQQLGYAQSQLDESRLKLDQERRANADGSRSSVAHKDLMEKLTELNLFRESSITLRNEARQAQTHLAEKTKRVEELVEQIQPLENKIRELEHGKETSEGEIRLLQEDRDRWQKRTQDILSKYDRIDPAEMEQLKETLESLRTEKDALLEAQQPMQEKLQALEGEKVGWEERRQKLIEQFKDRSRNLTKDKNDRVAERDAALKEKDALREQLTGLQQQLETTVQERDAAQQQLSVIQQELDSVKIERDQAISNATQTAPAPTIATQTNEQDQQLTELRQQLENVTREKQALEEQLTNMRQQLEQANSERDAALADAAEVRSTQTAREPERVVDSGVEDGQIDETPKQGISDAEKKALEDRIAAAEAKAKEQEDKAVQLEGNIESVLKQRSDKMKTLLNNKLVESRAAAKAQLEAEYALKLEQEKQIWLAEYKVAAPDAVVPAPVSDTKDVDTALAATPITPGQKDPATVSFDGHTMTDQQVREFLSTNPVVKGILAANIKKKVEAETQKIKQEHERIVAEAQLKAEGETQKAKQEQERVLAEAQQKADGAKAQAVLMEGKKSALKINMEQNKSRNALAKIEVVEKAAQETPEKPVAEVWEIAKVAKPPQPPAPAPTPAPPTAVAEPVAQPNGAPAAVPKADPKVEVPRSAIPQPQSMQQSKIPAGVNGTSLLVSSIPPAPTQPGNNPRPSGLPQRGGVAGNRGRGNSGIYQPNRGGGGQGRGRGGGVSSPGRGGMNPGAQNFNPQGPAGLKRPREEGSVGGVQQGNGGKRARGGGQN